MLEFCDGFKLLNYKENISIFKISIVAKSYIFKLSRSNGIISHECFYKFLKNINIERNMSQNRNSCMQVSSESGELFLIYLYNHSLLYH